MCAVGFNIKPVLSLRAAMSEKCYRE